MATKRKIYRLRRGDVLDVEEYPSGNYGGPGRGRAPRARPTPEQMAEVNRREKMRKCRRKLIQYFSPGDLFVTLTYEVEERPADMKGALKDFGRMMQIVRRAYKKAGKTLYWIRNIECGTRGAWHIHLVINEIGNTLDLIKKAWTKGGFYSELIKLNRKLYDRDFTKLASYLTKDENTCEVKKDGSKAKPRIRESSYSSSRNMPIPEPRKQTLKRWPKAPRAKKGYEITNYYEGVNPITGYLYRRYTMIRRQ